MPKNQVLVIAVVAIVLIAGIGAAFVLMGDDDDTSSEKVVKEGRLTIYGNANNDDVIDSKDVNLVKKILSDVESGKAWDSVEYQYADANYDGKITQEDVDITQQMAEKKHDHLYYLNANKEVDRIDYPVRTLVGTGTYVLNGIVTLGLEDITYGISGSKKWFDDVFWGDLKDKPQISTGTGSAETEKVFALVDSMRAEGKVLDAIITTDNTLSNEADFTAAEIDVLELPFGNDNEINAYLILGYLTERESSSHEYAEFYDGIMDLKDKLENKHASNKPTALVVYQTIYVHSDKGNHGLIAASAGIDNVWKYDPSKDVKNSHKLEGNDEWLSNEEWNADYIIGQEKMMYKSGFDDVAKWKQYQENLGVLDAMPEKCVIVNDSMLEPLKVAYLLEYLYPDEVEKGFGDKTHQHFVDTFVNCLANQYDVTKDGTFFITYDDVKDRL